MGVLLNLVAVVRLASSLDPQMPMLLYMNYREFHKRSVYQR